MQRRPRSAAFTLVELLVVVLILGILMSIALPSFLSSVQKSKLTAGGASARSIAAAVQADYVRSGGDSYTGYASSPLRNDKDIVADLGGSIPNNPCSNLTGIDGYQIVADTTSWKIWPRRDLCPNAGNPPIIKLGN